MERPIKIAYIIDTIATPAAGTEKQLLLLLNNLDKTRFEPYLICLRNSLWLKEQNFSFPVIVLNLNSLFSLKFIKALFKFRRLCKGEKFDMVQTFFTDGNIFGTIAARLSGIKIIISSRRNYGEGHWHNKKWLFILKQLRKWTTLYISNSQTVADYTIKSEKVNKNNIITIYNGIKFDVFDKITPVLRNKTRMELNVKDNEVLIGLVANWRPIKNIPLFLKVAFRLKEEFPNSRFMVVGNPPTESELSTILSEYNITNKVSFLGTTADIIPYLSAMDIGVLCSKAESLSNSIIEYLAAGLPCVVSQAGGNEEAIGYGIGGFVFKNDNADDFYNKLKVLILNDAQRLKFSEEAKKFARQQYNHKKTVKSYEDIYYKLVMNIMREFKT